MQIPELLARATQLRAARPVRNRAAEWYSVKAETGEVFIYDEIGFWGTTAKGFVKDIEAITGDLTVHLNSPGGDVFDGIAIYNALKSRKGRTVCVVDSLAASAASVIAMGGDEIEIAEAGMLMIHDAWGMCVGNEADMTATGELLGKASDIIADIYRAKGGGTREKWRARMREETWYSATEAVDARLADRVTDYADPDASAAFDLSIFNHAGRPNAPAPDLGPDLDPVEFSTLLKEAFK